MRPDGTKGWLGKPAANQSYVVDDREAVSWKCPHWRNRVLPAACRQVPGFCGNLPAARQRRGIAWRSRHRSGAPVCNRLWTIHRAQPVANRRSNPLEKSSRRATILGDSTAENAEIRKATYHNGATSFVFADSHAELHKWIGSIPNKSQTIGRDSDSKACSAGFQPAVAPNFIRQTVRGRRDPQIENLRYSRLKTCATSYRDPMVQRGW